MCLWIVDDRCKMYPDLLTERDTTAQTMVMGVVPQKGSVPNSENVDLWHDYCPSDGQHCLGLVAGTLRSWTWQLKGPIMAASADPTAPAIPATANEGDDEFEEGEEQHRWWCCGVSDLCSDLVMEIKGHGLLSQPSSLGGCCSRHHGWEREQTSPSLSLSLLLLSCCLWFVCVCC